MPTVDIEPGFETYYEEDYFGPPWEDGEPVVLLHGFAEDGRAWNPWVPDLARNFRVYRPELRGFGRSTFTEPHHDWSFDEYVADLATFMDRVGLASAHIVAAKIGGAIAYKFAAEHPERLRSLSVVSGPASSRDTGGSADITTIPEVIRTDGQRAWAADTMDARLGPDAPPEMHDWWIDYMASADTNVCIAVAERFENLDLSPVLGDITVPTLVLTTDESPLASVETVREWAGRIPDAEVVVLEGEEFHPAAVRPQECLEHVRPFLEAQ
ncbi:MAG: alpha/beta fold hydrolase [Salinirussus sp.]